MTKAIGKHPVSFYLTTPHPCPYLPEKTVQTLFLSPEIEASVNIYSQLIRQGFRRSGEHIYRPHCENCQACLSTRIVVSDYKLSRSNRRTLKNASQFRIQIKPAYFSQQHFQLYDRYISQRHADGDMYPTSPRQYKDFLLCQWMHSEFMEFWHIESGKLIACSVFDRMDDGLSALYTYFDPDFHKYSLGQLAILQLIELAKANKLDWVYLGYWIKDCKKMAYKGKYRPLQCYVNNRWVELT